mmetsp:Transcript_66579/g.167798  ORF Transcript_66579/g.167798 Transcript_66579/m.167798 type:complete len:223 (-) Transcript_66579:4002-4670(-)
MLRVQRFLVPIPESCPVHPIRPDVFVVGDEEPPEDLPTVRRRLVDATLLEVLELLDLLLKTLLLQGLRTPVVIEVHPVAALLALPRAQLRRRAAAVQLGFFLFLSSLLAFCSLRDLVSPAFHILLSKAPDDLREVLELGVGTHAAQGQLFLDPLLFRLHPAFSSPLLGGLRAGPAPLRGLGPRLWVVGRRPQGRIRRKLRLYLSGPQQTVDRALVVLRLLPL